MHFKTSLELYFRFVLSYTPIGIDYGNQGFPWPSWVVPTEVSSDLDVRLARLANHWKLIPPDFSDLTHAPPVVRICLWSLPASELASGQVRDCPSSL